MKEYVELENEEQVTDAYNAQTSLAGKLLYLITIGARNVMIMDNKQIITDQERIEIGMPEKDKNGLYDISEAQRSVNRKVENSFENDLKDELFGEGNEKPQTIDACKKYFEFIGSVKTIPELAIGKHYETIRKSLPTTNETEESLDAKTKYMMLGGLCKESFMLDVSKTILGSLDFSIVQNGGVNTFVARYVRDRAQEGKNIGDILNECGIEDYDAKNKIFNDLECKPEDKISEVIKTDRKGMTGLSFLANTITGAWSTQGCNKTVGALSEKDRFLWKKGAECSYFKSNNVDKKWKDEYGKEEALRRRRRVYKKTFSAFNKAVCSEKPIPYKAVEEVSDELKTSSLEDKLKKSTGGYSNLEIRDMNASPKDANDKAEYTEYIKDHLVKIKNEPNKNTKNLAKALSAILLKDSKENKSFSSSLIHRQAENLMVALDMRNLSNNKMSDMMSTEDKAKSEMYGMVVDMYATNDPVAYIKDMKKLAEHMMKDDDRSYEYQHMVKSVRVIANMKPEDIDSQKGRLALIGANFDLILSVQNYMKGKKSIRFSDDGKDRFDNSIDALAVMNKYVPGSRRVIDNIVDRINIVRDAREAEKKGHVDITKYGADRAEVKSHNDKIKNLSTKAPKKQVKRTAPKQMGK